MGDINECPACGVMTDEDKCPDCKRPFVLAKADDRTAKMRQALLDIANGVTDNPAATARGALV